MEGHRGDSGLVFQVQSASSNRNYLSKMHALPPTPSFSAPPLKGPIRQAEGGPSQGLKPGGYGEGKQPNSSIFLDSRITISAGLGRVA